AQLRRRAEHRLIEEIAAGRATDDGPIGEPEAGLPEILDDDGLPADDLYLPAPVPVAVAAASAAGADDVTWRPDPVLDRPRRSWSDAPTGTGLWASFRRAVLA